MSGSTICIGTTAVVEVVIGDEIEVMFGVEIEEEIEEGIVEVIVAEMAGHGIEGEADSDRDRLDFVRRRGRGHVLGRDHGDDSDLKLDQSRRPNRGRDRGEDPKNANDRGLSRERRIDTVHRGGTGTRM